MHFRILRRNETPLGRFGKYARIILPKRILENSRNERRRLEVRTSDV
jgi:hypothetical protein